MLRKNTAHRPSQSHLEYVRTRDGRKVKNTAYRPLYKTPTVQPTYSLPQSPSSVTQSDIESLFGHKVIDRVRATNDKTTLSYLIHDESDEVRGSVASHHYGLDILVHDPSPDVRREVVKENYGHDQLYNDPDPQVRAEVAHYTHDPGIIEYLSHDDNKDVKIGLILGGHCHAHFVHDTHPEVTRTLASTTQNTAILNILLAHDDEDTRRLARQQLDWLNRVRYSYD